MYRASPTTITKQNLSVICTWYLNRIVQSSNVFKGKNPHHHRFGFDPLMHHHEKKTLVIFFSGIESSAMFNHIQLSSWLYMVIFYNVCYNIYMYIYTISFHLFSIISTVTSSHQFPLKKTHDILIQIIQVLGLSRVPKSSQPAAAQPAVSSMFALFETRLECFGAPAWPSEQLEKCSVLTCRNCRFCH